MSEYRFKNILWRCYLSILTVGLLFFLFAIYYEGTDAYQANRQRKAITVYYEQNFGSLKAPGEFDWSDFMTNDEATAADKANKHGLEKLTDAELTLLVQKGKRDTRRCLHFMLDEEWVDVQCNKSIPKELSERGVDIYSRLSFHFYLTYFAIGLLVALLILRYWLVWMFTGQRPRSFP